MGLEVFFVVIGVFRGFLFRELGGSNPVFFILVGLYSDSFEYRVGFRFNGEVIFWGD